MKKSDQTITINRDGAPLLQLSAETAMALGLALQHSAQIRGASRGSVPVYLEMCEMLGSGARPGELVILPAPPVRNHSKGPDVLDALCTGGAVIAVMVTGAMVLRGDAEAAGWFVATWLAASTAAWVVAKVQRYICKGGAA